MRFQSNAGSGHELLYTALSPRWIMEIAYPDQGGVSKGETLPQYFEFDHQIDAQNSYLFTYNTFIKILYMFRALPCSSSGGLRRNCIYVASGIVTV